MELSWSSNYQKSILSYPHFFLTKNLFKKMSRFLQPLKMSWIKKYQKKHFEITTLFFLDRKSLWKNVKISSTFEDELKLKLSKKAFWDNHFFFLTKNLFKKMSRFRQLLKMSWSLNYQKKHFEIITLLFDKKSL